MENKSEERNYAAAMIIQHSNFNVSSLCHLNYAQRLIYDHNKFYSTLQQTLRKFHTLSSFLHSNSKLYHCLIAPQPPFYAMYIFLMNLQHVQLCFSTSSSVPDLNQGSSAKVVGKMFLNRRHFLKNLRAAKGII